MPHKKKYDPDLDSMVKIEKALLGCVLERPDLIAQVECDLAADLLLRDHQALWRHLVKLREEGIAFQLEVLIASKVDIAYITELFDPDKYHIANFRNYVSSIQQFANDRRFARLYERLGAADSDSRHQILEEMQRGYSHPAIQGLQMKCLSEVKAKEQKYLWDPIFPSISSSVCTDPATPGNP